MTKPFPPIPGLDRGGYHTASRSARSPILGDVLPNFTPASFV
jgi:hypothetical protein